MSLEEMRLQLESQNVLLEHQVAQKTAEIREILNAGIDSIALWRDQGSLHCRPPATGGAVGIAIAEKMGLAPKTIEGIELPGSCMMWARSAFPCPSSAGQAGCWMLSWRC